jgi:tetratricopeptide (TPR) repeat protein
MSDQRVSRLDDDPRSIAEREEFVEQAIRRSEEFRRQKAYQEGISLLVEALKYGIRKDAIYYRLGNLYIDGGDLARAEYAYTRALEVNAKHVNAMNNLAVVYKRQKKISQYVKTYKKAQRLAVRYPRNPDLSREQKSHYRRLAGKVLLWIVGGIGAIGVVLYLVFR